MSGAHPIDDEFSSLPRHALADAALSAALSAGASHAESPAAPPRIPVGPAAGRPGPGDLGRHHARPGGAGDRRRHLGIRLGGGTRARRRRRDCPHAPSRWRRRCARSTANASSWRRRTGLRRGRVGVALRDRPVRPCPPPTRSTLLGEYSARLLAADGVDHVIGEPDPVKEQTFYADTAGSSITQQRVRVQPQLEATAVDSGGGAVRDDAHARAAGRAGLGVRRPARRRVGLGDGARAASRTLLAEKVKAPSVTAGPTDLVIDPTNLWLTIHESIGHATEYDRAIGYEAAYAGTSFATPDKLGTLRYGSPVMNVTADRTERIRAGHGRLRRRGRRRRSAGIWCATASSSAISSTGCSHRGSGCRGPTAARMPIRRTTSRSSGWPTSRCSRTPSATSAPRS